MNNRRRSWFKNKKTSFSYTPFVNEFPLSWAVHSVKLENTSYIGPILRVRNRSTLVETDLYSSTDGFLDESLLISLISGSEILDVKIFYDQTGNGNDLLLSSSNGAVLIEGGLISKDSGLISPLVANNIYQFNHSGELDNNANKSCFSVIKTTTSPDVLKLGTRGTTSTGWLFRYQTNTLIYANIGSTSISGTVTRISNLRYLLSFTYGSTTNIYNNDTLVQSGTVTGGSNRSTYEYGNDTTGGHNHYFHFHALFDSDQNINSSIIINTLNEFYSVY